MNLTVITYALYLMLAVPLTIWVARTLHKNGRDVSPGAGKRRPSGLEQALDPVPAHAPEIG